MNVIIRSGVPEDASAVSLLALRAKASVGYPPDWVEVWRDPLTIRPDYLGAHTSLVALRDDQIVGICILERQGSGASLEHVWVAPELQRQGIGRALVERELDVAARAGVHRVTVESDPAARAFYLRLGARSYGYKPAPMPGAPERVLPILEFSIGNMRIRSYAPSHRGTAAICEPWF